VNAIKELKTAWDCIYGRNSHVNLAGKIILGVPLFPFVAVIVLTFVLLDALFSKAKP
jgi:hypothetical protein